jgi:uncharacterized OB-fold protein
MSAEARKDRAFEERFGIRFTRWGKPFWEGTSEGEFRFQVCGDCGNKMYPARLYCTNCMSSNLQWVKSTGKGRVYTYSIAYEYPPTRVSEFLKTPYIIALVDLEEGIRVMTNIEDCEPEDVSIGMNVAVKFVGISDGFVLPRFQPD